MAGTLYFIHKDESRLIANNINGNRFLKDSRYLKLTAEQYNGLNQFQTENDKLALSLVNCHQGEECHIFGNGPSLLEHAPKVDWTGAFTIGVNAAPLHIKNLRYWLCVENFFDDDRDLFKWIRNWASTDTETKKIVKLGALNTRILNSAHWKPYLTVRNAFDPSPDLRALYWASSSVQAAIDMARLMGASKIYLWGIDYAYRTHSYTNSSEIPKDVKDQDVRWDGLDRIHKHFEVVKGACDKAGLEILNCNLDTWLRTFYVVDPEQVVDVSSNDAMRIDFTEHRVEVSCKGKYISCDFSELDKKLLAGVEKLYSKISAETK